MFCAILGGVEEEAHGIWTQLQQRDWVDPDLDLGWIMEKLAQDWEPWSVLARDRSSDTGPVQARLSTGPRPDQVLVDRLRTLARAPYEATPWPDPPNVDLGRLADDYERTTGHHLEFTWEWEAYPQAGFWSVMVSNTKSSTRKTMPGKRRSSPRLVVPEQ